MSFKVPSPYYSDGYKVSHKRMLAPGVNKLYGTWIPRSLKHMGNGITKAVSAGQQLTWRWLNDEWVENFFEQPVEVATRFGEDMSKYLGMDYDANHFVELHKLGYLPMKVKALPEGIETDVNIPHMTFINTVDGFAWLTLYLETIVSALSWKTSTAATIALKYRRQATEWVMKTDPNQAFLLDYMCHDFSARGLDPFTMIAVGLGHAMSHRGSDNLVTIPAARYFYDEPENEVCVNSVNASEHSVSTTKIFTVGEKQMIIDWLKEFPVGILSIVADTFDLWKLLTEYIADPEVKELIMARDGKLVIRPDSGDPVDIICGHKYKKVRNDLELDLDTWKSFVADLMDDKFRSNLDAEDPHSEETYTWEFKGDYYDVTYTPDLNRHDKTYYYVDNYGSTLSKCVFAKTNISPESQGVIEILWDTFGGTINEQGYKVLDSHIGCIYGDAITLDRQVQIYSRLADKGFAATNIVLGVGSYTYQMVTRDTMGFAAKGGWFSTDDKEYAIYKDPVTDDGTKKSPRGLLLVTKDYELHDHVSVGSENGGMLQVIFEDGKFYNKTTLTEIREKLNNL